ncbi:hypothetical protein DXB91_05270 [Coprococcus sp. OM06-34AC]|uniref:hypothetical protein n=1 Tax=unclassified Coprococcus TaxID=2684943 RepID=UPI000E515D92|nr:MULTISPECIES: hypothetical protein [unclassified Coprococcus]RGI37558.1 hypothetical protein DXB91_05270 [Coprococcus sp. OM06-34AC]RHU50062.1 hypothetical protein DXD11_11245 [Coprococcus sp. TF11-13]
MGFIYSSLNRGAGESVALFDNRIARMLPFVTGKAYFDLRNYDAQTGEFGVYIEWDGELEAVLGYSLPAGGYFVKATTPQAYRFHRLDKGLPVYMKLIAQNGRLYPYRTYVMMDGRPFSVEFGGGVLIPFEDRYEELGCEAAKQTVDTGSQKLLMGSQSGMTGSQRFRWNGSQMRLLFGSQGGFRYLAGSQYRVFGSQRMLFGSQRMLFGSQRMLLGSQRILSGSQYRIFGSQRIKNMPMVLESDTQWPQDSMDSIRTSQELMVEFPKEWQLINRSRRPTSRIGGNAKFGYGLDLI